MEETVAIQSKLMKKNIKVKKVKMLYIMLFLVFFSSATFRNQEYLNMYIGVSIIICLYSFFRVLCKPSRLLRTILNSFAGWLVLLFSIYFFYGLFLTRYSHFDADYFFFMFIMTIVTLLLFIDMPAGEMVEIVIKACAIASIAVCLFIIIAEWSLIVSGSARIGESGSGNVNTVAVYLGTMSIPLIYKYIFERNPLYLIPYGLSIIVMLMTGSKKALLFIILGVLILTILKNRYKLHKYVLPTLIIIALFFIIFNNDFMYNIIGARTIDFLASLGFNIEGAGYSNSTTLRLMMYKLAFEAFLNKPIFGGGWFYFSSYSGLGTYSHSNYMELLVTYGIVGFSIYYSMFFYILIRLKRLMKVDNYAKLIFTILVIILINDAAAVSFSYNLLNYLVLGFGYLYLKGLQKKINSNVRIARGAIKNEEKPINSY